MQQLYKTLFLATTILFFSPIAFSQAPGESGSEIIMSKGELESFLTKVAALKKERIEKRREDELTSLFRYYQQRQQVNYNNPPGVNQELDRLNRRLDALTMQLANDDNYDPGDNSNKSNRNKSHVDEYTIAPPSPDVSAPVVNIGNKQPPVTGAVGVTVPLGKNKKVKALQKQIDALNDELYALNETAKNDTARSDYQMEINNLKEQIAGLEAEIVAAAAVRPEENRQKLRGLEQYRYNIYFTVNSTDINRIDKDELRRLAASVKANEDRVTVIINGFASRTGSAIYNNKLSFSRTEAVKQALLQAGLSARNIVSLHHGVDYSKNLSQARRAEITLLVY